VTGANLRPLRRLPATERAGAVVERRQATRRTGHGRGRRGTRNGERGDEAGGENELAHIAGLPDGRNRANGLADAHIGRSASRTGRRPGYRARMDADDLHYVQYESSDRGLAEYAEEGLDELETSLRKHDRFERYVLIRALRAALRGRTAEAAAPLALTGPRQTLREPNRSH